MSRRGFFGTLLNNIQSGFVGLMRAWTIPIVLMLSFASGYTTYYGMQQFITDWIALIITIAVQSIIVITSYELAACRWKANRVRYVSIIISLLIALTVSVSFSYFKFHQISETENIQSQQITGLKRNINAYLAYLLKVKSEIIAAQKAKTMAADAEARSAYLGKHPTQTAGYRNQVGAGPFWRQYNKVFEEEQRQQEKLLTSFDSLSPQLQALRFAANELETPLNKADYRVLVKSFQTVRSLFEQIASDSGMILDESPTLLPYAQFSATVRPSFAMWETFVLFPFFCALMVDFFTILLSYRLEYTAPAPLSDEEEDMVYNCLRQFSSLRVNHRDELELVISKTQLERSRRVPDWSRTFATAFLLKRGFLRKVDKDTVEFSSNLYPIIAQRLGQPSNQSEAESQTRASVQPGAPSISLVDDDVADQAQVNVRGS